MMAETSHYCVGGFLKKQEFISHSSGGPWAEIFGFTELFFIFFWKMEEGNGSLPLTCFPWYMATSFQFLSLISHAFLLSIFCS